MCGDKCWGDHRMVEVGRDLWRSSGPTPLLKHGHLEPVAQDYVQMAFALSPGRETPQPLWATCPSARSPSQ